jgi:ubiquinone/menaquinone biosynthesis C-methylase UbiE
MGSHQIAIAKRLVGDTWLSEKIDYHCGTIQGARCPDACFDHVFSFCVLEHITDLPEVLAELRRILKPNGQLHASVDSLGTISDPDLLRTHKTDHYVHQYFTPKTISDIVTEAGFAKDHVFPILRSDYAKEEFEKRIIRGNGSCSIPELPIRYQQLRRSENESGGEHGLMIIVHAHRTQDVPGATLRSIQ